MARLAEAAERAFWEGARATAEFFVGAGPVHSALRRLVERLEAQGIPYAIVGALALNEFGYRRATSDVGVLLTEEGLRSFKAENLGRGYVEKFPGSRGLRDTQHGVDIDVVLAGEYPGDGKPKSVRFPDPAQVAERGRGVALLSVERLVELKLASGLTAPHRLRDLADVQELIRAAKLPRGLADLLDPMVRAKYEELWASVQAAPGPDGG